MTGDQGVDSLFRDAVSAIDSGDVPALESLLTEHPDWEEANRLANTASHRERRFALVVVYHGTPMGWAEYGNRPEIIAYLRQKVGQNR